MMTCSKTYAEIPFAHRQHRHPGHCSLIHGHNWSLKITFACERFDGNGFVVDFGNLKYIKRWLDDHLDHGCVLAEDDPLKEQITNSVPQVFKLYEVPNASCEGISLHLWEVFSRLLYEAEGDRVWIAQLDLYEDARNATCFVPSREEIEHVRRWLAHDMQSSSASEMIRSAHEKVLV